jgi:hypothetical protein
MIRIPAPPAINEETLYMSNVHGKGSLFPNNKGNPTVLDKESTQTDEGVDCICKIEHGINGNNCAGTLMIMKNKK